MDSTVEIMKKSFSPERKAVQAEVLGLVRDVEMGKGDKMELAMKLTALTKRELEAKAADADLKYSVDNNIKLMKRAMDKLTGVTESVGEIAELTETEVVKIIRSKRGLGSLRNRSAYDGLSKIKNIELDKKDAPKKAAANESIEVDSEGAIAIINMLKDFNWDKVANLADQLDVAFDVQDAPSPGKAGTYYALGEYYDDVAEFGEHLHSLDPELIDLDKLEEAEFDEAAGEKDACYRKVKSRYKVWPSAYASGALVKCRKVGAANWGNSKKK